ncbi:prepilin peptidase [Domibacillus epiphyticus]|uniref:Prepilin peptidase n=1 Tax=Domibacillus epiphyticus TaxID=1714355 RepID=A0A1V2A967_9BACI|nr:A24 family peptidase [Domibacillus epiphyticus]OMP67541.1 prepilin peptidase [Domibacillus epiphyticus]
MEAILFSLFIFTYGLICGSFFNVAGIRIPVGKSVIRPRSACPVCKKTLSLFELIPVISYVLQRGKCRACQTPISPVYVQIEMLTGCLWVAAYWQFGFTKEWIAAITLISLLMIIIVSDFVYMIIPNSILLYFFFVFILEQAVIPVIPWQDAAFGFVSGFLLPLLVAIVSKGGMGAGDIKLFAVIGLSLGFTGFLLSFFFSVLFGTLAGIVGLMRGNVKKGVPFPFGPWIAAGTITSLFIGESFLVWYLSFY